MTDLELGSEDDPSSGTASAGHATHPIRKRIAIKLRQGGKGRASGGTSGKKAKTKAVKDVTNEGGQARHDNEDDTQFGINYKMHNLNDLLNLIVGDCRVVIFTALHGMQTQSSDENSVCPSVRPSVRPSVCQMRAL